MKPTRLGIVVAEFNRSITMKMLEVAKGRAKTRKAQIRYICFVPGTFDMPLLIEQLIKKKDIDAIVTLGSVIKGETAHDKLIAYTAARFITELSIKHRKPISLGIAGPGMTVTQAKNRITTVSKMAVDTAIDMVERLKRLENVTKNLEREKEIVID
ncbi:MAG TPA: 6,7-dimethyl-8-ribityllumazine synthase [Nitrososphaeraceae archaeon]